MFKIIKFVPSSYVNSLYVNPNETYKCNLVELKNDKILEHENF